MKKGILILLFILICANLYPVYSLEMHQLPQIPGSSATGYRNYLQDTPSTIVSVTFLPYTPKEGQPVQVEATIYNDPNRTEEVTVGATLYYSTNNGESWEEISMDQSEENEKVWKATIPGFDSGIKVIFYISAVDSAGNIATEIPGMNSLWPPLDNSKLTFTSRNDAERDEVVPSDIDILETYAGYDDEYLYIKMVMENNVNPGTTAPPFLHFYGALIINPDMGFDVLGGFILGYMPYLKLGGLPEYFFYDLGRIGFDFNVGAETKVEENILYLRVKRTAFGDNPSNTLRLLHGTLAALTLTIGRSGSDFREGALIDFLEYQLKNFRRLLVVNIEDINRIRQFLAFEDATPYTNLYLTNHSYVVR